MSSAPEPMITIGDNPGIDSNVQLGYQTGRDIESHDLEIGDNAILRSGTIIYGGTKIGHNFESGHYTVIREQNVIGNNCKIWTGAYILPGCIVGNGVTIHFSTCLGEYTIIEDDVFLGGNIVTTSVMHPHCEHTKMCMRSATIKAGAVVGSNTLITPTVTIGEHAFIGGGSVVTKDIPANAIAYGNPARVRGTIADLKCPYDLIDKPYGGISKMLSPDEMRRVVDTWWAGKDQV
ncbi:acyltransferase [Gemmatimonadota bacterium]